MCLPVMVRAQQLWKQSILLIIVVLVTHVSAPYSSTLHTSVLYAADNTFGLLLVFLRTIITIFAHTFLALSKCFSTVAMSLSSSLIMYSTFNCTCTTQKAPECDCGKLFPYYLLLLLRKLHIRGMVCKYIAFSK
jgi:hypothetical protein